MEGDNLYVTGNLTYLGVPVYKRKEEILENHYKALWTVIGQDKGTIIIPTHSFSLCNTEIPFAPDETASETGILTEYIRNKPGSVRQMHPFSSVTAIGKNAKYLCTKNSRHVFGLHSPFDRMIELNTKWISIGLAPNKTCTAVHHAELMMNVPYRYIKEFIHPILINGKIKKEPFYLFVTHRDCDIIRNKNVKIFNHFTKNYELHSEKLERGKLYLYSIADFYKSTTQLMDQDIFAWLEREPSIKPYRI